MLKVGTAVLDVEPKFDGVQKAVAGQADGIKSRLSGAFKSVAFGAGAIFAGVKITGFLGDAISEFRESAKVGRLTESVIKSTGGAANVSAQQVGNLANALAAKSGIDDEVIQSGENVLATFTNIRNEAGKGNDIFNQATTAATNLSAALGQDMQSSVIQLGKALNDPVKGVTALQRVGVSFTQQQRDQIRTLVESGKTLEAQKIILGEVQKEFGGAAKAAADPMSRLKVIIGNLKESVGAALVPALNSMIPILAKFLPEIGSVLGSALKSILPVVKPVLESVVRTAQQVFTALKPVLPQLAQAFSSVGTSVTRDLIPVVPVLGKVAVAGAKLLAAIPPPVLAKIVEAFILFKTVKTVVGPVGQFTKVIGGIVGPAKAVASMLSGPVVAAIRAVGVAIVSNPIGLIIAGVIALGAAVVLAYQHFKPFRDIVDAVGRFLRTVFVAAFNLARDAIASVVNFIINNWPLALAGLTFGMSLVVGFVIDHWNTIKTVVMTAINFVWGVIQTVVGVIVGFWQAEWNAIVAVVQFVWGIISGAVSGGLALVSGIFNAFTGAFRSAWEGFWGGLKATVDAIAGPIVGAFNAIIDGIRAAWNAFRSVWNSIELKVPSVDLGPLGSIGGETIGLPDLPRLWTGGIVRGSPSGTPIVAGDRNQAEAVIPLPRGFDLRKGVAGGRPIEIHNHFGDRVSARDARAAESATRRGLEAALRAE